MNDASKVDEDAHHRLRLELSGLPFVPVRPHVHRQLVIDERRMHCIDWGEPESPPVLFLHGGGQTCRTWDVVCHVLADRYRCVALDQRGHGDSEWSYEGDYGFASHVRDIEGVLDALGLERVVAVGMSMGAINALELTLTRPQRVAALVCVDAGPWVAPNGATPIRNFMAEVEQLDSLDACVRAALRFNPRRDARLLRRSLLHNLRKRPDGRWMWKTDRRFPVPVEEYLEHGRKLRARIHALPCPLLVMRGGESEVMSDEDAARFARAVPDGRWVRIEGAGHTIQGDQPRALTRSLQRLLVEICPPGTYGTSGSPEAPIRR